MVKSFNPERKMFIDASSGAINQATNADVEQLICADTNEKLETFLEGSENMFGFHAEDDILSLFHARLLLSSALKMLKLSRDEDSKLTFKDANAFGLAVEDISNEWDAHLRERDASVREQIDLMADTDVNLEAFAFELGDCGGYAPDKKIKAVEYHLALPPGSYADFLERMMSLDQMMSTERFMASRWAYKRTKDYGFPDEEYDGEALLITCSVGFFEDSKAGLKRAFATLFDLIASLHLADVRTISLNAAETRSIATGISSLWWAVLDSLRVGRVGMCDVCNKPFITNNERGKKRKYCSEACRQWRKVHPGTATRMSK